MQVVVTATESDVRLGAPTHLVAMTLAFRRPQGSRYFASVSFSCARA